MDIKVKTPITTAMAPPKAKNWVAALENGLIAVIKMMIASPRAVVKSHKAWTTAFIEGAD